MTATVECRRCGRPLTGRLAREAGIGGTCALRETAQWLTQVVGPRQTATPSQLAVALVSAFLHRADYEAMEILNEGDMRDVAGLFAAATALHLEDLPDGEERLRRFGLAAAED